MLSVVDAIGIILAGTKGMLPGTKGMFADAKGTFAGALAVSENKGL